jgi:hypothetical protein
MVSYLGDYSRFFLCGISYYLWFPLLVHLVSHVCEIVERIHLRCMNQLWGELNTLATCLSKTNHHALWAHNFLGVCEG